MSSKHNPKKAARPSVVPSKLTGGTESTLVKAVHSANAMLEERGLLVKNLLRANYNYRIIIGLLLCLLVAVYLRSPVGVEHISVFQENAFEIQQLVFDNWERANITLPHWDDSTVTRFLGVVSFLDIKNKFWDKQETSTTEPLEALGLLNYTKNYPVILVPGFVTSKLELWRGRECMRKYLRSSVWGGLSMLEMVLKDILCWADHMTLDTETGLDLDDIKLRVAGSAHSIDYLFPGYWVWAKLIEYLALIGYDDNDMVVASYDWRLAPQLMETRDHYFTRLKKDIEVLVELQGKKAVAISHSMGSNVWFYFLKWAEFRDHFWASVNIGGALLGSMKGISTLLSGEMKDSAEMEIPRAYVADNIFPPLQRSWTAIASLLPKGGSAVWGAEGSKSAPDKHSPHVVTVTDPPRNLTVEKAFDFLFDRLSNGELNHTSIARNIQKWYAFDTEVKYLNETTENASKYWTNPLQCPLPYAPQMKTFCLYGVNKPTERGFYYKDQSLKASSPHSLAGIKYAIDTTQENYGIKLGDGDGTVPLVSLGYMCMDGWRWDRYNPEKSPVITREYNHNPISIMLDVRGGRDTADHVDIMGNVELLQDVMSIVSGSSDKEKDKIISNIEEISKKIRKNLEAQHK